jgi:adenylate cyclase class 2
MEIEVKAKVQDPDKLRAHLNVTAAKLHDFYKDDTYLEHSGAILRLRKLKVIYGSWEEVSCVLTHKIKLIKDGIESNKETEISVVDFDDMLKLLIAFGFRQTYQKIKIGHAFKKNNVLLELCEVPPLGWFLEAEMISDDIEEAKRQVTEVMNELGFTKFEPLFYKEMLMLKGIIPTKEQK